MTKGLRGLTGSVDVVKPADGLFGVPPQRDLTAGVACGEPPTSMSTTFRNLVTKCDCRQRPARGQVLTGVIGQPYSRSAPSSIGVDGIGPIAAMVSAGDRVTGTAHPGRSGHWDCTARAVGSLGLHSPGDRGGLVEAGPRPGRLSSIPVLLLHLDDNVPALNRFSNGRYWNGPGCGGFGLGIGDHNPCPKCSPQGSYTVAEGATQSVTVTLSADPERTVVVPIATVNQGTASDADYSGVPSSVTFDAGETSQSFTFSATQDTDNDDGESVQRGFRRSCVGSPRQRTGLGYGRACDVDLAGQSQQFPRGRLPHRAL